LDTQLHSVDPALVTMPVTHHEVSGQEFLQELRLLVLYGLDDKLVVTRDVEEGPAGTRVGQLDQRVVTQRILREGGGRSR